jgi:DNA-binding SARP family transcriptional activator
LKALAGGRLDVREQWRVTMLRAFAAFRRGANEEAASLSARAMEEAARLGMPQAPLIRERAVVEQLLVLAAQTGQPAAVALDSAALPTSLAVLGRFELTVGGRTVKLARGQEARLLKFVTACGGQVHIEEAIEALWPEAEAESGRHRLRTVLHRLRAAAGPVLDRSGEMLVLADGIGVDLYLFEAEAARALGMPAQDRALAVAVARGAVARYRGDLLPEDRFEDWAERTRDRARRAMLDLLDLCAREASARGDLDELRRVVEQSIAMSPYDDSLYTRAVTALVEQGRRGEALSVINRARAALGEIGLESPAALVELEQSALSGR